MDAVESYKEIETKLTNVKAKQIEMMTSRARHNKSKMPF